MASFTSGLSGTAQLELIYIGYFNRAAEASGYIYWANELNARQNGTYPGQAAQTLSSAVLSIARSFSPQAESVALYPFLGISNLTYPVTDLFIKSQITSFVTSVYNNLFGRAPDATGLAYWVDQIAKGERAGGISTSNAVLTIADGAGSGTDAQTIKDAAVLTNKIAVSNTFLTSTIAANIGIASPVPQSVIDAAKASLVGVTDVAATVTAATATITAFTSSYSSSPGQTFILTTGVDQGAAFTGGAGNDTFNALSGTAATATLTPFDTIDGGLGTDTLDIADTGTALFAVPASVTISRMDIVNVARSNTGTTTGEIAITDTTFGTGVGKLSYLEASASAAMTAATAAITLASATDVTVAALGTGTFTTVAVTDKSTDAALRGSTLKNVTIGKASGAATLHGNAIQTVNLTAVGGLTTVNADAGTRSQTVNASGTTTQGGLTDATATTATLKVTGAQTFGTLTVAKATTVNVIADAAATVTVAAAAAKTLNISGTNLLTLTTTSAAVLLETINVAGAGGVAVDVSSLASLTSVNTTDSTAAVPATGALTGANTVTIGATTAYVGGAGQDIVTVGATSKSVDTGAGNDTVNVTVTALAAGGSVNGGQGIDVLKLSNANAVTLSTAGATQIAFKAAVTGFETLDITTQSASTIDISKIGTFSQVNMVSASAAQVLSGITSGMTIESTYGAAGTSITTNALTAPSGSLTFVMKGDLTSAARVFGELATPGVETLTLKMLDTSTTVTEQLATLTVTDSTLKSLTISGNNGLALTHAGTGLYNLDASGVTKGAVTFTSGALTTDTTVKGTEAGGDTFDLTSALAKTTITSTAGTNALTGSSGSFVNTITGGTGADTITGGAAADILKGGAGADTIRGNAGADSIDVGTGTDRVIVASDETGAGTATAGALTASTAIGATTLSFSATAMDVITNFGSIGDNVQIYKTGTTGIVTGTTLLTGASTWGADTVGDVALVRGSLVSSVFTASTTGADSALIWDDNGTTAAGTYKAVILVGYLDSGTSDTISAAGLFTIV